jgi:hypothetical protein
VIVMLPLIARDGAFAAALARVLAQRGGTSASFDEHARALLAPRRRENYLDHIPGKKLKELRRQRRRLEDAGAIVHMAASGPAAAVALTDFMALEAAGWKGRAGGAARADAATETFMREAVIALAAKGDARIDRLTHDGQLIAASITPLAGWAGQLSLGQFGFVGLGALTLVGSPAGLRAILWPDDDHAHLRSWLEVEMMLPPCTRPTI